MTENVNAPAPDAPANSEVGDVPTAPETDQSARIAELEAQLAAAKADKGSTDAVDAPKVDSVPLPADADTGAATDVPADDDEDAPHIVSHSGERMLLSEYRKTKEFLEGFVKGE